MDTGKIYSGGIYVKKLFFGKVLLVIVVFFINALLYARYAKGKSYNNDRVLFISSYSYAWDTVQCQIEGIKKGIAPGVTVDYEFMDTKRFSSDADLDNFYKGLKYRLSEVEPYDVVILGDDAALEFGIKYQDELFDKIPLVYEGINNEELAKKAVKDPYITGVIEKLSVQENIDFACKLFPETKNVIIVLDDSVTGKAVNRTFYSYKDKYPDLEFSDINTSQMDSEEIREEIASLKEGSILIYVVMTEDAGGRQYTDAESIEFIYGYSKVPVFKMVEGSMDKGIIGGNIVSMELSGQIAAEIAMDILNGTPLEKFNKVIDSPNIYCIDEDIMRKFGLDLSLIPDGAEILNHKKTFLEQYGRVLKPAVIVMLVLALFIILAWWDGRKYKRMSEELAIAKDKLENAYHHDILTGINNRTGFNKDMEELKVLKTPFALIMIDIDNFKFINDTYGHTIGDEALRQIAMRLTEVSDINFTPYRFAGDEFIVIAKGTKDSLYEDEAKRCISIFSDIFDLSGIKHNIHGSIGIAMYPQDTEDFASLVVYADCAMYEVKNNSKNSYKFYKDIIKSKQEI
jgi:diguanylate cyclase (GGDEF) domain